MNEPIGVVGVVCPEEAPLLAFVSLVAPLIAMGNRIVAVPSERHPLAATDFYQVLETSDVPAGVVNIVTGAAEGLTRILAEHDDVDGLWVFGAAHALAWLERSAQHLLMWDQPDYPALLAQISDAPPLLFVAGNPTILANPQLALVGSRRASRPGMDTAAAFSPSLAGPGLSLPTRLALATASVDPPTPLALEG